MTRLQYLKCRNRKHLPYGQLPESVKCLFRHKVTSVDEFSPDRGWYRTLGVSGAGTSDGGRYGSTRVFRARELSHRPSGIPEELHKLYT